MDLLYPSARIYLSLSTIPNAGRGVFAKKLIRKGELIERCPVVEIPKNEVWLLKKSLLHNYYFLWGKDYTEVAIALGFGSLYNHSYTPNATYKKMISHEAIDFIAIEDIEKDMEISVNYNFGNPDDRKPLWIKGILPAE